ncbi:MAG: hypothetical protein IKZ87_07900 [Actinomycetaceae bacterium]|nr:hypothetical protein [Actinomycetaceae bacterium]
MDRKIVEDAARALSLAYKELLANECVSEGEADALLAAMSILNGLVETCQSELHTKSIIKT